MKSNKVTDFLEKAEMFTKKNSPAILTGMAIVGVISTAYASFKAGPRADKILEEYRKDMSYCDRNDKEAKRFVVGEAAKKMVPVIAPPIIMGGSTIACIIGSHSVSSRRIAALSAAYSISESTVKNLNNKMEELFGEKKARAVKDAIMKDKLKADAEKDQKVLSDISPIDSLTNFIMPADGTVLCKDLYSGRLFYSNAEKIKQAIAKCSYDVITDMYISLNDFYEAIGSPQLTRIPMGEDLGWNLDDTHNGQLPITLTALLTEDMKPCLCIDYDIGVRADFRNLH